MKSAACMPIAIQRANETLRDQHLNPVAIGKERLCAVHDQRVRANNRAEN
jgi:hypothetical protein